MITQYKSKKEQAMETIKPVTETIGCRLMHPFLQKIWFLCEEANIALVELPKCAGFKPERIEYWWRNGIENDKKIVPLLTFFGSTYEELTDYTDVLDRNMRYIRSNARDATKLCMEIDVNFAKAGIIWSDGIRTKRKRNEKLRRIRREIKEHAHNCGISDGYKDVVRELSIILKGKKWQG
jgi:hypothetical protein